MALQCPGRTGPGTDARLEERQEAGAVSAGAQRAVCGLC
jgi:hypothetical protein